jgi:hypothetical protein
VKTVRDHIASQSAGPQPPPEATHGLAWEPYGLSRARWALVALDGSPDDDAAAFLDGPADLHPGELLEGVSALLGCPVWLSQIEMDGDVGYYVTPAGGGR